MRPDNNQQQHQPSGNTTRTDNKSMKDVIKGEMVGAVGAPFAITIIVGTIVALAIRFQKHREMRRQEQQKSAIVSSQSSQTDLTRVRAPKVLGTATIDQSSLVAPASASQEHLHSHQ